MNPMRPFILIFIAFRLLLASAYAQSELSEVKQVFKTAGHRGSFLLYDLKADKYSGYNLERCKKRFSPASTFKIPNSLIGLETGVLKDQSTVFKWDSVKRFYDAWNRDCDLSYAIQYSVVWYYQELARRVGKVEMKNYINKLGYGNKDISPKLDEFWLRGNLKISQFEQIEFLRNLYSNKVPFAQRNIDIVKSIILRYDTLDCKIRAKTGWSIKDSVGWYVGWVEKNNQVWFFATNIDERNAPEDFAQARISITIESLKALGILPKEFEM
jgi:beta-lactamase class D